jgi:hypothetical protein
MLFAFRFLTDGKLEIFEEVMTTDTQTIDLNEHPEILLSQWALSDGNLELTLDSLGGVNRFKIGALGEDNRGEFLEIPGNGHVLRACKMEENSEQASSERPPRATRNQ